MEFFLLSELKPVVPIARDEPCSCSISWRILVEELILYAELLGVAGLRVEVL